MKENIQYPSYFSVIPAKVRYNPNLSFFEIVLFSELVSLSNYRGFTWASNAYFAALYKKAPETISRSISKMEKLKLLKVDIDKSAGNKRIIYVLIPPIDININSVDENNNTPIDEKVNPPIDGNVKHNNSNKILNKKMNNNFYIKGQNQNFKKQKPDIEIDWLDDYYNSIK